MEYTRINSRWSLREDEMELYDHERDLLYPRVRTFQQGIRTRMGEYQGLYGELFCVPLGILPTTIFRRSAFAALEFDFNVYQQIMTLIPV